MIPDQVPRRVILLASATSYRAPAFSSAAERLGLEVVRGLDAPRPLGRLWRPALALDYKDPDRAVADVVAYARRQPVAAILAVDDLATVIAARACRALGLPHNAPDASWAARDKHVMRQRLSAAGVPGPGFRLFSTDDDPDEVASSVAYPCVVKPILLSGSQGVIRADDPGAFADAFRRTRAIVLATHAEPGARGHGHILVEDYLPGFEVALEGVLSRGRLSVLALFDKPDPLVGPFFEETIYVTPSRLPEVTQQAVRDCVAQACAALGLREGPVHAELRIDGADPWVVEVAARSIGGLCSRILRFGTAHVSLEEVILRQAIGMDTGVPPREKDAGGVMMIPIPRAGILARVDGLEVARSVPHVTEIDITLPLRHEVVPLPEGSSYLGFIFARAETPAEAEASLREAHRQLDFVIVPRLVVRG